MRKTKHEVIHKVYETVCMNTNTDYNNTMERVQIF